jgi:MAP3K TRAFs-binding domain
VLPYALDDRGRLADPEKDRPILVEALQATRAATTDSPVFQLIDDLPTPQIDRLKTDVFRDQAAYSVEVKKRMATARAEGPDALRAVERDLGALEDVEAGVMVDLLLSYRAAKEWEDMIRLVEAMPAPVRRTILVRDQYGFALNRAKRGAEAEKVLLEVIDDHGPSSETLGLVGRVYKDRWEAEREGSVLRAEGHLEQAIDAYRRGFEADWRDAYPGVNAVTLMEIRDPGGSAQQELLPVVRYANRRRVDGRGADYWITPHGWSSVSSRASVTRRWPARAPRSRSCASAGRPRAPRTTSR